MKIIFLIPLICITTLNSFSQSSTHSIYTQKPKDENAVYFNQKNFEIISDGMTDCTQELQKAIDQVEANGKFGIVFVPEGTYLFTNTVYVWKGIRLIGYGTTRPKFLLKNNTEGFSSGTNKYMIHFVSGKPNEGEQIRDANPGTFYSAISNIDFEIKDGNKDAVAIRSHFAQHCFLSNINFNIGEGKAGVDEVGNEISNCRFIGGEYGITTTKPSPSWPFLLIDSYFEGQKVASIETQEGGFTIIRNHFKDTPSAIVVRPNREEKLFMEDCRFENISSDAIIISDEFNACPQFNIKNLTCINSSILASFRISKKKIKGEGEIYRVVNFTHGNIIKDLGYQPKISTEYEIIPLDKIPDHPKSDIPELPNQNSWVNIIDLGAIGDGITDNTSIIQNAIDQYKTIYFPTGRYRVTNTILLKPATVFIGLSPITTQLILLDETDAFSGLGSPKALLETPKGGTNIVTGIGLDAGGINPRAVGAKWMAGEHSMMNDVKFLGGHGTYDTDGNYLKIYNNNRTGDGDRRRKWDSQYWSLWITNGGGGTFKDIWTASTFAMAGLYVSNTEAEGRIYAMSIEHHVRYEAQFKNVSNWKVYAFQMEEERGEGWNALPVEIDNCSNIRFANLYLYRSMMSSPFKNGIVINKSKNIEFCGLHAYSPTKYTYNNTLYDATYGYEIRSREIANLKISGNPPVEHKNDFQLSVLPDQESIKKLATGFECIDATTADDKGNVYFLDGRWHKIYKWSVENEALSTICDLPFNPVSMGFDKSGNLLVTTKTNQVVTFHPDSPVEEYTVIEPVGAKERPNATALIVGHLWRNEFDFLQESTIDNEQHFVSLDESVYIPYFKDLSRAYNLRPAKLGNKYYMADEFAQKTYEFEVGKNGSLNNPTLFAEEGEFDTAVDANGNVYIAAGQVFVYDKTGNQIDLIKVPERPSSLVFGGKDNKVLYIAAGSSLYSIKIK